MLLGTQCMTVYKAVKQEADAAEAGETPFLSEDGAIFVPGSLERRKAPRRSVGIDVWIESIRGRQRVTLRDLSSSGAGLAKCRLLLRGMPITVQLPAGRRLLGTVVWIQGDRAGVRFHIPLVDSDPVLMEGHFLL